MGGILGTNWTERAAEKLSEGTLHAFQRFNITENTINATEAISKIIHSASPLEVRVSMDVAPAFRDLIEKLYVFIPISLFLLFLVLTAAWHTMNCFRSSTRDPNKDMS
jgi:hypothetical protein